MSKKISLTKDFIVEEDSPDPWGVECFEATKRGKSHDKTMALFRDEQTGQILRQAWQLFRIAMKSAKQGPLELFVCQFMRAQKTDKIHLAFHRPVNIYHFESGVVQSTVARLLDGVSAVAVISEAHVRFFSKQDDKVDLTVRPKDDPESKEIASCHVYFGEPSLPTSVFMYAVIDSERQIGEPVIEATYTHGEGAPDLPIPN